MAIQVNGLSGTTLEADATFKSLRTTVRPAEGLGFYSWGAVSGALTAVAANGPVFSFRNTGPNLAIVRKVMVGFVTTTAFTTAQGLTYSLIKANAFTASDSGGTALFTAGANKHRNSFTNWSSAPDVRISSTGALTAGTRTLETVGIGVVGGTSNGVGTSMQGFRMFDQDTGDYPLVFAQNEGFIITNLIAMGALGVIQLHVNIEVAETTSY